MFPIHILNSPFSRKGRKWTEKYFVVSDFITFDLRVKQYANIGIYINISKKKNNFFVEQTSQATQSRRKTKSAERFFSSDDSFLCP
jgi:hypothetical protein